MLLYAIMVQHRCQCSSYHACIPARKETSKRTHPPPFKDTSRKLQMPLLLTCRTSSNGHPWPQGRLRSSLDSRQPSTQPNTRGLTQSEKVGPGTGTRATSATGCFPFLMETSSFRLRLLPGPLQGLPLARGTKSNSWQVPVAKQRQKKWSKGRSG